MTGQHNNFTGLILLGAGRRTMIAAIIVAALWALFYWATSSPSAL